MSRRAFVTGPLALLVVPLRSLAASPVDGPLVVKVTVLGGLLRFELCGTLRVERDRAGQAYRVAAKGDGSGFNADIESRGVMRGGRWAPVQSRAQVVVYGRETSIVVDYDYQKRVIDYRSRSETFFLKRLREAEDHLGMDPGRHVDDALSAMLNYADQQWPADADGHHRAYVVRRRRRSDEKADEVTDGLYRGELVPLALAVKTDARTGEQQGALDLSRFSTWPTEPARIAFRPDRWPNSVVAPLQYWSRVTATIATPCADSG